ncbi:hypothetical protein OsI_14106 [Oryza sativa Indica Group]|uniref:Disease resistance N-terminal domain-containing protein n=1 Tax=Oryza sativa subsp. indica TaxID=39946 RepID=A2XNG6_ORYSI|nr:hypothetical protein OsI_14106 [Oryza sativa Indica Group]
MAEEVIGSITTAVTAVVADRAVSKILENFNQQTATAEKLQRLEMLLIKIHSTIEVSEKRAIKSAALIQWQDKLKEAASRGEEVLHSFQQREADVDEATGQNASDHQQQQEEGSSSSSVPATALSFKRKALSGMAQRVITIAIALFSSDEEVKKLNGAVEALEKESANIGEFIALLQLEASPNPKRRRSQMSSNNMEGLSFRLQEGDANTRFLHQHSAWRPRKNFVQQIEHNSQIATAPDEKAALAHNFFSVVLGSERLQQALVDIGESVEIVPVLDIRRMEWLARWADVLKETERQGYGVLDAVRAIADKEIMECDLEIDQLRSFVHSMESLAEDMEYFDSLVNLCPQKI